MSGELSRARWSSSELRLVDDPGEHTQGFLQLAALASSAHDNFTFRDPAAALRFYTELYRRGGADFAPPAGRLLIVDGQPAAMFALATPDVLRRRRLVGALMFARSEQLRTDPSLADRLRRAATAFVRPLQSDGYLSRLAVASSMTSFGIGQHLLSEALNVTKNAGLQRCVLEVADTNLRALGLYQRAGFEQIGHATVSDPATGATLGYVHMARAV